MMKVLITGGSGFIGSHLVEHYQNVADEIRVLDNFRTGFRANLASFDHHLMEGSICDRELVKKAMDGVDIVYHLAALVSVPESMESPCECLKINGQGLLHVLEEAASAGVKKVVFASSAAVYGNNPTVPKREEMIPEPRSPYAITKLDGEYYLDLFRNEGKFDTASIRFFNVFGPRQDPKGAYAAAVPIFMEKALKGEDLTIFGDGGATRDFIYVKDIVGALTYAAENPISGVFNAGYGTQMTIRELAEIIIAAAGSKSKIIYAPERAGDVRHSRACNQKLLATGWRPQCSVSEALKLTMQAYAGK